MSDFSDFTSMIALMMTDFGTTGVLTTQPADGVYDPATGTTTVVSGDVPVTCIIMDRTLNANGAGNMEKRLIADGDKMAYVSPSVTFVAALMPGGILKTTSATDRFTAYGIKYGIVRTKVINVSSDGLTPLLFELYLRV